MCRSPKQPPESEVLVLGQMLVAEKDHQILGQRAMDLVESPIAERFRQIDAADLAADDRGQLVDRDRVVRPCLVGDIFDAGTVAAT